MIHTKTHFILYLVSAQGHATNYIFTVQFLWDSGCARNTYVLRPQLQLKLLKYYKPIVILNNCASQNAQIYEPTILETVKA